MPLTDPAAITAIRDLMQWHRDQVEFLTAVKESSQKIVILDFPDQDSLELTEEQSKGFRLGLMLALEFIGELPLDLAPEDTQEVH
jgi:hypothetical protein